MWEPNAGRWRCSVYGKDKKLKTTRDVPLFPFVAIHKRLTNGAPVVPADEDLNAAAMAISVTVTNLADVVDQQSHADRVYKGNKSPQFTGGTSSLVQIGPDEDLTTLSYPTEVEQGQNFSDFLVKLLAVTRQQPADAYTTSTREVLSGVSRLIANIPATRAAAKRVELFKDMEQRRLLPLLWNVFRIVYPVGVLASVDRVQFRVVFPRTGGLPETERDQLDRVVTWWTVVW